MTLTTLESMATHLFADEAGRRWMVLIRVPDNGHEAVGEITLREGKLTASCGLEDLDPNSILCDMVAEQAIEKFGPALITEIEAKKSRGWAQ